MSFSIIDILFLVTVALLVFNGLRNGAVFSLVNLLSIPIGIGVALYFGPQFIALLAANHFSATPLIAYVVLFFGAVLIVHILATTIRGVVQKIPLVGAGDALLGGLIGFVEAWLLWLILLIILGTFLANVQNTVNGVQQSASIIPGLKISFSQLQSWHDFYNQAVTHSIFAQVNSFFNSNLHGLPQLPQ